ncbi:hypothetical protein [Corynebacterium glutamicum]|uniref:hypothetical protein n=1 Tax=Corynebacterium glutamicum TaxID=1718 RepID=UPI0011784131|nr:hypothetical protein [Corynebacterium glutamicum]
MNKERDEGWTLQRQAMRCLLAIEAINEQMSEAGDNVESEWKYFLQWTQAIFAYPEGWKNRGHGISDSALESLGMFSNLARRFLPEVGPDFIQELQDLLQNEPSLTPPPGAYPSELFDYFTRVKYYLKTCLEDYSSTNTFDLMRAAEDYRAAVFMMANGYFVSNPNDWAAMQPPHLLFVLPVNSVALSMTKATIS